LHINGWKYWTMGAPIAETILINRKPLAPEVTPYDAIATQYDGMFQDAASAAENHAVMDILGDVTASRVLDIGCGTGLLLDYVTPGAYCGLDPSTAMVAQLATKHPAYASSILPCRFEDFVGQDFDLVTCLFGSANYIDPDAMMTIPALLRPGGRYVLMFFQEGYTPVTHIRTGLVASYTPGMTVTLPGTCSTLGHFMILDGTV
jgi:SAM-dependent methyltransferase